MSKHPALPADLPELMTIPEVARRGLLGYTSKTSVEKLVARGLVKPGEGVQSIDIAPPGAKLHQYRIPRSAIVEFWERKTPARKPRKK